MRLLGNQDLSWTEAWLLENIKWEQSKLCRDFSDKSQTNHCFMLLGSIQKSCSCFQIRSNILFLFVYPQSKFCQVSVFGWVIRESFWPAEGMVCPSTGASQRALKQSKVWPCLWGPSCLSAVLQGNCRAPLKGQEMKKEERGREKMKGEERGYSWGIFLC